MAVSQNKIVSMQAYKKQVALCTAAKTTYNDGTNAVLLATAGPNGSMIHSVKAIPRATVTATQCMLFLLRGGVYYLLPYNALMAAHTVAVTTAIPATDLGVSNFRMESGDQLYAAISVALAGGVSFVAEQEDL